MNALLVFVLIGAGILLTVVLGVLIVALVIGLKGKRESGDNTGSRS
jgi:hypothetical protein